jgi:cell division protein FtsB
MGDFDLGNFKGGWVDMEMDVEEVEHKEVPKCESEVLCMQDLVGCECSELDERSKKAEARCVELELDIQKKKSEYEALETKFRVLEADKLAIEDELKALKRENDELKKLVSGLEGERKVSSRSERDMDRIVDLIEENWEEDKIVQLLIEIRVLECEKERAESEVEVWKEKFKELESLVLVLNENSVLRCVELPLICGKKRGFGLQNVTHDVRVKKEAVEAIETLVKVGSTICHSPGKGIGDLQAAGTKLQDILIICFLFKCKL